VKDERGREVLKQYKTREGWKNGMCFLNVVGLLKECEMRNLQRDTPLVSRDLFSLGL
jgi:hypothetical protein